MVYQSEIQKLSKRELFERCKELDEAIKELRDYDAADSDDFDQATGAYFSCIREYNEHYELLFRRMFKSHKIFKAIDFDRL